MENHFQKEIAGLIAEAIASVYGEKLPDIAAALGTGSGELDEFIYTKLETPKDRSLGDFAFPTFQLAKPLGQKPQVIAQAIGEALDQNRFTVTGPYINAIVEPSYIASQILPEVYSAQDTYGSQKIGQGKKIIIDYSSPNIAKPFGVGHLRSTAIGNSLYRVLKKLGYQPIGVNHLGDWGTQFGKMIVAYRNWGDNAELEKDPIKYLFDLYVRFHKEEKENPSLSDEARAWFKKLEDGDEEAIRLWKLFKEYSMAEFKRIYAILGVSFDAYTGESFYNKMTDDVVERLTEAGLAVESQGALVVDLEKYELPPCLLRKADGATLYATRDLAGIFYRKREFDFEKAIYVVGGEQKVHFNQVFKVIELLGEPYADRLIHVDFGWIRFKDQHMSTREGNIIFLEDVINTAMDKAREIIKEKNPNLANLEETAQTIALGAIIFADLGVKKHKDVNFSWSEVLTFEGETGPYLQYTHARLAALGRKYGREITADVDFSRFVSQEEKELLLHIYRFGQIVELVAEKYEPNFMAEYLLELAAVFNRFYQRKDAEGKLVKIISDDEDDTRARMLLVLAVKTVLKEGLRLMGIEAPEEM